MSHFQRMQYRMAPHYLHDYPHSPRGVHPVMPLQPMMPYTYGDAYGWDWSKAYLPTRKMQETLRKDGANLAVYDLYDAVDDLDDAVGAGRYEVGMSDVRTISSWPSMATLAANDSSSLLKTGYFIKLAGLVMLDPSLVKAGDELAERGYTAGEKPGSGTSRAQIVDNYTRAVELIKSSSKYKGRSASPNVDRILNELDKGTIKSAVAARVKQADEEEDRTKGKIPVGEGGTQEPKCEQTWKNYIPGYCTGEKALTYATYAGAAIVVAGLAYGVYKAVGPKVRSNPSAPGRTDDEPENDIANMPKAREQETRMNKHVFKRSA